MEWKVTSSGQLRHVKRRFCLTSDEQHRLVITAECRSDDAKQVSADWFLLLLKHYSRLGWGTTDPFALSKIVRKY